MTAGAGESKKAHGPDGGHACALDKAARAIRAKITRLEDRARKRARARVRDRLGELAIATQFAPSRRRRSARACARLAAMEAEAYAEIAPLYRPQIERLRRKLARIDRRRALKRSGEREVAGRQV